MNDQNIPLSPRPLSARHERFVLEYLRDANATQAYIRAGYSPRGAQPSASKLLRDVRIAAAISAGRQRLVETLEVNVERLAQEYAKIAFANVADYVSTDADGGLRVDLDKASEAQRAGILELKLSNHRNPEQRQVTLKLGKLQALAALTKNIGLLGKKAAPGLTAEDRERYEERHAADQREVKASNERCWAIQLDLAKAQEALAWAESKALAAKRLAASPSPRDCGEKVPSASEADEGLPRATTDAVAVEPPQSPSALRAPSPSGPSAAPDRRGEKEDGGEPYASEPRPRLAPPEVAGAGRGVMFYRKPEQPRPSGPTWHEIINQGPGFPGQHRRPAPQAVDFPQQK